MSFLMVRPDPSFAQARDTASLFGTLTDAQRAVVPGARVQVEQANANHYNLSKVAGTHIIKAGAYLGRTRKVQFANADTRGTIKFDKDNTSVRLIVHPRCVH